MYLLTSRLATASVATSLVPPYRVLEKLVTKLVTLCPPTCGDRRQGGCRG